MRRAVLRLESMPSRPTLLCFSARNLSLAVLCATNLGCGGSEPRPKTQDEAPTQEVDHLHGIQASSEIGGLNEEEVDSAFKRSVVALQACVNRGAERVEFLGGSVAFFLKINGAGKVEHAHLERSTLGDRATEKCMLAELKRRSWPKPVGGEHGLARKSFDFDPPNDVRPATEWDAEEVSEPLAELKARIDECKAGGSGDFEATAYVATDGSVLAASVTPPDESGDASVDCLVEAVESTKFPSPGSWPAKVTFSL